MRCGDIQATVVLRRAGTELARWPLRRQGPPDLALVDELARLHLTAARMGCAIHLRRPSPSLLELLHLVGLDGVVVEHGSEPDGSG